LGTLKALASANGRSERIRSFGFFANRGRTVTVPLCRQLLETNLQLPSPSQATAEQATRGTWACPLYGGPMVVIDRLTAQQIRWESSGRRPPLTPLDPSSLQPIPAWLPARPLDVCLLRHNRLPNPAICRHAEPTNFDSLLWRSAVYRTTYATRRTMTHPRVRKAIQNP
jgi:hypothetical protein